MSSYTEQKLENDYIARLQSKGWTYIHQENLERESLEEPLLTPILTRSMKRLVKDERIGQNEITQALNELKLRGFGAEDQKKILFFLKNGITVKVEKDRTPKTIPLIDYQNIQNNEFIVSRQITHKRGEKQVRNDIILYVNGIPLINIELKDPTSPTESWATAFKDIEYYQKTIPELYKYVQIGIAGATTAKYFPITSEPKPEDWKVKVKAGETETTNIDIFDLLSPQKLLNILQNYLFIRIKQSEQEKIIARYMQYNASEKICKRVIERMDGKNKKNGLIWHWQGSGKTLTMLFAANKLYQEQKLNNPSIFFIVDRDELETQLGEELASLQISAETIQSVAHLKQILEWDGGKGKKGIFLTLIHKFRLDELIEFASKSAGISQRKNIISFIDEGHRTQYGDLAAARKAIFANGSSFAFTGTPIKKSTRNTYQEFSYPPEEKCLDKYFLKESQEDGFTLKMIYEPRLEKQLMYDKEGLDAFLSIGEEEIPEEYRADIKEATKQKLNRTKVILENPERINKTAKNIAKHFLEHVDNKFKGMVVAVNKKACVEFKRALDQLLPKDSSEVVMSYSGKKDLPEVQDYRAELEKRFGMDDVDKINKQIKDDFKKKDKPKLVIVTDMLLAGYDAPILQTMYLVKPMKGHKLLQAIARTNRPFKDIKQAGLILDYVGVLREINRAFEEYEEDDWQGSCQDIEKAREDFALLVKQTHEIFKDVKKTGDAFKVLNEAIRILMKDDKLRQEFEKNCKKLMGLYEILAADEIKLKYYAEYKWIIQVYEYYQNTVEQEKGNAIFLSDKYFKKTLSLIHSSTEIQEIRQDLKVHVLDKDYLENLEKRMANSEEKTSVALFDLHGYIKTTEQGARDPVVETISDKVEKIVHQWRDRTEDMQTIFQETKDVIHEMRASQSRKEKLGFNSLEYAILVSLESGVTGQVSPREAKKLAEKLKPNLYHGWLMQQTARKEVEKEIRVYLRKYVREHGMSLDEIEPVCQKIVENVVTYAAA